VTTSNATVANATYLASKTGLTPAAAYAWLAAEGQQVPNPTNPLNIKTGGAPGQTGTLKTSYGTFAQYASPQAGLDAAAWLVHNGDYPDIRSTLNSGNAQAQTEAIDSSRWGTSGAARALASVPGSLLTAASNAVGGSTTTATQTSGQGTAPTGPVAGSLTDWFTQGSPTAPLTPAMVAAIVGDLPVDNPNNSQIEAALNAKVGTPINQVGFNAQWFHSPTGGLEPLTYLFPPLGQTLKPATDVLQAAGTAATDAAGAAGSALGALGTGAAIQNAADSLVTAIGVLGAVAVIGVGIWLYARGQPQPAQTGGPVAQT